MKTKSLSGRYPTALEELGRDGRIYLEFDVEYEAVPEEPRTWDYPGCPAYIDIVGARVSKFEHEFLVIGRKDRPDWFELLDRIVFDRVMDTHSTYCEWIAEDLDSAFD